MTRRHWRQVSRPAPESRKLFVFLVDKILAAKKNQLDADVSSFECEIDQHVCKLCELTTEEIAVIEGK